MIGLYGQSRYISTALPVEVAFYLILFVMRPWVHNNLVNLATYL